MKTYRIIIGIIAHPFKVLAHRFYRSADELSIQSRVRRNAEYKAWERMHNMSEVTNTGYTTSEIYEKLMKHEIL